MMHEDLGADGTVSNNAGKEPSVSERFTPSFMFMKLLMHWLPPDKRQELITAGQVWKKNGSSIEERLRILKLIAGEKLCYKAQQIIKQKLQQQHPQNPHQKMELQKTQSEVKQPDELLFPFYSLGAGEDANTDGSRELNLHSSQLIGYPQQVSQSDIERQTQLQKHVGNSHDILFTPDKSAVKMKHEEPLQGSVQQVKYEFDRSASIQSSPKEHQDLRELSVAGSQVPVGFHPQNAVEHGQAVHIVTHEKLKLCREQKEHENDESLRNIEESHTQEKPTNLTTQSGTEQRLQLQSSQVQSEKPIVPVVPYLATPLRQETSERQMVQIQTLQSMQPLSAGEDFIRDKTEGTSGAPFQHEIKQSASAAPNTSAVLSSMNMQTKGVYCCTNFSNAAIPSDDVPGKTHFQQIMPGSLTQQIQTSQIQATQRKAVQIQRKPLDTTPVCQPPSKKFKVDGGNAAQSVDPLIDVTIGSVDLRQEEEQLLVGPKERSKVAEAMHKFAVEEESNLFLEKASLHAKVASIATKYGINNINNDVERCLSMSVEERLWSIVRKLTRLCYQRKDPEHHRHITLPSVGASEGVTLIRKNAKEESDRKHAEEAEQMRKLIEEKQRTSDPSKEPATKTQKDQQQHEDKERTAANRAARVAVGVDDMLAKWQMIAEQGRQKRDGDSALAGSGNLSSGVDSKYEAAASSKGRGQPCTPTLLIGKPSMDAASDALMSNSMSPKASRRATINDMIAILELEPQLAKSELLYKLYGRKYEIKEAS